jgi:PKD repeat protein
MASPAARSIDLVSVTSLAPAWIRPSSRPAAVLGVDMFSLDSSGRLLNLSVNFTDAGSDGRFNFSDLAPPGANASSGVALYMDNKTAGVFGSFDQNDTLAPLASQPLWDLTGPDLRTTLCTTGLAVPSDNLGNNSGPDFFVVIRTSAQAADGDDFSVSIESGDIDGDAGPLAFEPARTGNITVDAIDPRAEAGADQSVDAGSAAFFDGGGSTDNNGMANWSWFFGDFAPDSHAYGPAVSHIFRSAGQYIVVLTVTDAAGNTDEDSLAVTVRNVNRPPTIISSPPSTAVQGETYFYLFQASDPDGDMLRFSLAEGPPEMTVDPSLGLVVWTPGANEVGAWKVVLSVTDGLSKPLNQSYYVTVIDVPDPPRFTSTPVLIAIQGQQYSYKATAEDPEDQYKLEFKVVAGPRGMTIIPYASTPSGGQVSWTPSPDQVGLNRVVLGVTDGKLWDYQVFDIEVANANDPPLIMSVPVTTAIQGLPYSYLVQASDPDDDALRYLLVAYPTNMSIVTDTGLIEWVPAADQVGQQHVVVQVLDGRGGVFNQSYTITVADVNDPPVIEEPQPPAARQGALWTFRVAARDQDGDRLVFTLVSAPSKMTLNSSSGELEWTPGQGDVGTERVVVLASDGRGGIAVKGFNLAVQDVNDPPAAVGTIAPVAYVGQAYVSIVQGYDPDGDELTYSLITGLPDMAIDRHTGLLLWYPSRAQAPECHIAVRITDTNGSFVEVVYNVTVIVSNGPPQLQSPGVLRARAGERFRFAIQASDPDGDRLVFTSSLRMLKIDPSTGEMAFIPRDGDVGVHAFTVKAVDPAGLNATASGVLIVDPRPEGAPLTRMAQFAMAGIGGLNPWLVLAISFMLAGALTGESVRLWRRERRQRAAIRNALVAERQATAGVKRAGADRPGRPYECGLCGRQISIKAGADHHACPCGARYHLKCFKNAGRCPRCGRGRGRR